MNQEQTLFAEMLGMKKQSAENPPTALAEPPSKPVSDEEGSISELDVQREVVEEMAREKAELEERCIALEQDKHALEGKAVALEEKATAMESKAATLE